MKFVFLGGYFSKKLRVWSLAVFASMIFSACVGTGELQDNNIGIYTTQKSVAVLMSEETSDSIFEMNSKPDLLAEPFFNSIIIGTAALIAGPSLGSSLQYDYSLDKKNSYTSRIYFATDRSFDKKNDQFGTNRAEKKPYLSYGFVNVNIPKKRSIGVIPTPPLYLTSMGKKYILDDSKYMFVRSINVVTLQDFFGYVTTDLSLNGTKKPAFIYIHGFNNSFEDAALRTAQIAVDLNLPILPVFYSWPSMAEPLKYDVDRENNEWTESHLYHFLEDFADKSNASDIFIVAHSMGNHATTRALASLLELRPNLRKRFKQVILAAPDIDAQIFIDDIAPRFEKLNTPVTLYASSKDKALLLSHKIHEYNRAGDVNGVPPVIPGVDFVDASYVDTNFMGHDYFASSRPLLTDIGTIFRTGARANVRAGLKGIPSSKPTYWAFPE